MLPFRLYYWLTRGTWDLEKINNGRKCQDVKNWLKTVYLLRMEYVLQLNKNKSHKCNFGSFGGVNVFSLCCSTLCPVHIYFWSFTSLIENGIYQPAHKYISMACSTQKTQLVQVLPYVFCEILKQLLKMSLTKSYARMAGSSFRTFFHT